MSATYAKTSADSHNKKKIVFLVYFTKKNKHTKFDNLLLLYKTIFKKTKLLSQFVDLGPYVFPGYLPFYLRRGPW